MTSTSDPTHREIFRVSVVSGTIEHQIQDDNIVTTRTLTCDGPVTVTLNPQAQPEYLSYESGCQGTNMFVTENSNPTGVAGPLEENTFWDDTSMNLSSRDHTCVAARVGTSAAPVPYTGVVRSIYRNIAPWCDWSGCVDAWHVHGKVCSPRFLGGFAITTAAVCETWNFDPWYRPPFNWHATSYDLAYNDVVGGQLSGVGSYGGYWLTSTW